LRHSRTFTPPLKKKEAHSSSASAFARHDQQDDHVALDACFSKLEIQADSNKNQKALWLWRQDDGKYASYEGFACDAIEDAFDAYTSDNNQRVASFTSNGNKYCIDFSNMVQYRPETKYKLRPVRHLTEATCLWYWQTPEGPFRQFTDENGKLIEAAHSQVRRQ